MPTNKIPPDYNPDKVIILRSYGIKDLKRYSEKIKKNIKVFEEAKTKEKTELKRVRGMIKALQNDIKEAKRFKSIKKKFKMTL